MREYRAQKRRVIPKESDDSITLRAQQVREGRKPMEKGKYQRLNRFGSLNYNMNSKGNTLMDNTSKGDSAPI